MSRKLIVYISMSLDGYLATKEDDLSWLSMVEDGEEDYGYQAFNETVDTYIVGRRTYDIVRQLSGGVFPPAQRHTCYVITSQEQAPMEQVHFYQQDPTLLVAQLKQEPGKNIYCDGGAQLLQTFLKADLIDEFIISVIPILLGAGKRLFLGDHHNFPLKLVSSKAYPKGLVQLHYRR